MRQFRNEIRVMRRLASHHHIIGVHDARMAQRELALILTPVADGGDLAAFLQSYRDASGIVSSQEVGGLCRMNIILLRAIGCLASGLAFMHQQTIRHKDIKPQNILIHHGSVLYTDFEISFDFSQHGQSTTTGNPQSFTRRHCAPEVAEWGKRNSKADVFSLGCVYIEILAALYPQTVPSGLLDGPIYEKTSENSAGLIALDTYLKGLSPKMLALNPDERPSAARVRTNIPKETNYFCQSCLR